MTSRAAPHHSEGSLSAARSELSSFLDGMDCPHVKIARGELLVGVSSALGVRTFVVDSPEHTQPTRNGYIESKVRVVCDLVITSYEYEYVKL